MRSAWAEQPAIPRALNNAVATLRAEGDAKVWTYTFQAFAYAHPRIDVHAQMADELPRFLHTEFRADRDHFEVVHLPHKCREALEKSDRSLAQRRQLRTHLLLGLLQGIFR